MCALWGRLHREPGRLLLRALLRLLPQRRLVLAQALSVLLQQWPERPSRMARLLLVLQLPVRLRALRSHRVHHQRLRQLPALPQQQRLFPARPLPRQLAPQRRLPVQRVLP